MTTGSYAALAKFELPRVDYGECKETGTPPKRGSRGLITVELVASWQPKCSEVVR